MSPISIQLSISMKSLLAGAIAGSLFGAVPARAASEKILYEFKGRSDGAFPVGNLLNVAGTLYGVTTGAQNLELLGNVFKVTPSGALKVLYTFKGGTDGAAPAGGLIMSRGVLFGTTTGGASSDGTVFKMTTEGAETVIHLFMGPGDGAVPVAGVIDVGGTLYGTTAAGGNANSGTIFSITSAGVEQVLYAFQPIGGQFDGNAPNSALIDIRGTLYGTTGGCSISCQGAVFQMPLGGSESLLYPFVSSGEYPAGKLIATKGALHGVTSSGGANGDGTAYKVSLTGSETVLYSFGGGTDGAYPQGGLTRLGTRYFGTTSQGGGTGCGGGGCGTVFSLTRSGAEKVLYSFNGGSDGASPSGSMVALGGKLYGTTMVGGGTGCFSRAGCGTIFEITP